MYRLSRNAAGFGKMNILILVTILVTGLASYGYGTGSIVSSQLLADSDVAGLTGGLQPGACGIVAGIAIGVLALGVAGISMGFGAALVLSAGAHVAAGLCISS